MAREFQTVGYNVNQGTDEHDTPIEFFRPIADAVGGFDLDPAASESSNLAKDNVRKSQGEDGLNLPWDGRVWLNPPYSEVGKWLEYAKQQHFHRQTTLIVALVFARTSTQWWHNHATTANLCCLVEGRISFAGSDHSAPAPSAILIWGEPSDPLRRTLSDYGQLVEFDS